MTSDWTVHFGGTASGTVANDSRVERASAADYANAEVQMFINIKMLYMVSIYLHLPLNILSPTCDLNPNITVLTMCQLCSCI